MGTTEPTIGAIQNILADVKNFVFADEMVVLARYGSHVADPHVILTIGSYRGCSDICLAAFSSVPVYAIDFHAVGEGDDYQFGPEDRREWTNNVLKWGVADKIRSINLNSRDVSKIWRLPIGLLFVDGSHSYEAVRDDIAGYLPYVAPGALVAFHDHQAPQILQAIRERIELELIGETAATGFYRKVK